jgi:Ca2+-binding RTX toxin-like protein
MAELLTSIAPTEDVSRFPISEPFDPPGIDPRPFPLPQKFNIIDGDDQNNIIATTAANDLVNAKGGDDFITGSRGRDIINGDAGFDTMSYARLGGPIRLGATGTVNKGAFGNDQLNGIEKIVASLQAGDAIDASNGTGVARIDADLSLNSLSVFDIPGIPNGLKFTVENFEDVVGTNNNDKITGDRKNNSLNGGNGDDIIAGTSGVGSFPGLGEVDSLTGGGGNDKFILGRGTNLYYNGGGDTDFAKITDFTDGADQVLLANGRYALNADETQLFALNVGDNGAETRDLIAKIAYAPVNGITNFKKSADFVLSDGAVADPISADKTFSLADGQSFGKFSSAVV